MTIRIKTLSGRTVFQKTLSSCMVNYALRYAFRCTLAKRTYRFSVLAIDAAGNRQTSVGGNLLTVNAAMRRGRQARMRVVLGCAELACPTSRSPTESAHVTLPVLATPWASSHRCRQGRQRA